MDDIEILTLDSSYAAAVAKIETLCFSDPWSEGSVAGSIESGLCVYLGAFFDETLAGYVSVIYSPGCAEIANLAVRPDFRRMGLGETLMRRVELDARRNQSDELLLDVRQSNLAARRLYEKLDFEYVGTRKNFYAKPREDALLMTKRLADG